MKLSTIVIAAISLTLPAVANPVHRHGAFFGSSDIIEADDEMPIRRHGASFLNVPEDEQVDGFQTSCMSQPSDDLATHTGQG